MHACMLESMEQIDGAKSTTIKPQSPNHESYNEASTKSIDRSNRGRADNDGDLDSRVTVQQPSLPPAFPVRLLVEWFPFPRSSSMA